MRDDLLSKVPTQAQDVRKSMAESDQKMLMAEMCGQQLNAGVAACLCDGSGAVEGAGGALRRDAMLRVAETLCAASVSGVGQGCCRLHSFSCCAVGWPGHGAAAASFTGERVGGPSPDRSGKRCPAGATTLFFSAPDRPVEPLSFSSGLNAVMRMTVVLEGGVSTQREFNHDPPPRRTGHADGRAGRGGCPDEC